MLLKQVTHFHRDSGCGNSTTIQNHGHPFFKNKNSSPTKVDVCNQTLNVFGNIPCIRTDKLVFTFLPGPNVIEGSGELATF